MAYRIDALCFLLVLNGIGVGEGGAMSLSDFFWIHKIVWLLGTKGPCLLDGAYSFCFIKPQIYKTRYDSNKENPNPMLQTGCDQLFALCLISVQKGAWFLATEAGVGAGPCPHGALVGVCSCAETTAQQSQCSNARLTLAELALLAQ